MVERPAGSIEIGATTAYDPITAAAAARSTYNVDGTGMTVAVIDTGVDYNNPALGGGFGPNAQGHRRLRLRRRHSRPDGNRVAARHLHRRLDRVE